LEADVGYIMEQRGVAPSGGEYDPKGILIPVVEIQPGLQGLLIDILFGIRCIDAGPVIEIIIDITVHGEQRRFLWAGFCFSRATQWRQYTTGLEPNDPAGFTLGSYREHKDMPIFILRLVSHRNKFGG
jgi:hypothetical protein